MWVDGGFLEAPANSAILYTPGQKVYYKACREVYRNDWLRFSTTETYVSHFPVTGRPFPVSDPEYCHHLFKLLTWESSMTSPDSDLIISNLLQSLFLKLRQDSAKPQPEPHATELTLLRKHILDNPQLDWNVAEMAKERLTHTSNTILEISESCGYRNVEHFCRQFRKYVGCSPDAFRRER